MKNSLCIRNQASLFSATCVAAGVMESPSTLCPLRGFCLWFLGAGPRRLPGVCVGLNLLHRLPPVIGCTRNLAGGWVSIMLVGNT